MVGQSQVLAVAGSRRSFHRKLRGERILLGVVQGLDANSPHGAPVLEVVEINIGRMVERILAGGMNGGQLVAVPLIGAGLLLGFDVRYVRVGHQADGTVGQSRWALIAA